MQSHGLRKKESSFESKEELTSVKGKEEEKTSKHQSKKQKKKAKKEAKVGLLSVCIVTSRGSLGFHLTQALYV